MSTRTRDRTGSDPKLNEPGRGGHPRERVIARGVTQEALVDPKIRAPGVVSEPQLPATP
jgi:hypothetical protein